MWAWPCMRAWPCMPPAQRGTFFRSVPRVSRDALSCQQEALHCCCQHRRRLHGSRVRGRACSCIWCMRAVRRDCTPVCGRKRLTGRGWLQRCSALRCRVLSKQVCRHGAVTEDQEGEAAGEHRAHVASAVDSDQCCDSLEHGARNAHARERGRRRRPRLRRRRSGARSRPSRRAADMGCRSRRGQHGTLRLARSLERAADKLEACLQQDVPGT